MAKTRSSFEYKEIESLSEPRLTRKKKFINFLSIIFWFLTGFTFAAALVISFVLLYFQTRYKDRVIPGVFIDRIYVGDKKKDEIVKIFTEKNQRIQRLKLQLILSDAPVATVSAKDLSFGYDTQLAAEQSMMIGKTRNTLSNIATILSAYVSGISLKSNYTYNNAAVKKLLATLEKEIYISPQDAQFIVENSRVTTFKESRNGRTIDFETLDNSLKNILFLAISDTSLSPIGVKIPIKTIIPNITTDKANTFGIIEVIGQGKSQFVGSIPNRVYNIQLAARRVNGILIAPNEEFSFLKYLGDVSAATGYKQAYIIQSGRTILGDGGGVCQVSTTLFRAILNAGLPITVRNQHSYRVGYYEQDSPPGIDAAVYYPSVDFKFKNDTGKYILIQNKFNPQSMQLTYTIYGKKDNRQVSITKPLLINIVLAPPDKYQDDPTLPKGSVKQVDFAAPGGTTRFTRTVSKNGAVLFTDSYVSNYAAWQAVYLRGTQ